MPESLFTWQALAQLAGAAFMCFLVVSYTKAYVPLPTDLYAVLVGFLILLLANVATGQGFTWSTIPLALFNGFLVAATAGKLNDKAIDENRRANGAS